jgi:hypothetical protein
VIEPDKIIVYIFVAGAAATAIWRFTGFVLASGLSEEGPVIQWVKAVSVALVAGLISRLVLFPPGALADIGLTVRLGAFAFGVLTYFLARHRMGIGVFMGTLALIAADLTGL